MKENISKEVERIKPKILDFTKRLIKTPSESGKEKEVAKLIMDEMRNLGFDEVIQDKTGNILGEIKGNGAGDNIMYNCHMDHVSEGEEEDWEYPPYGGVEDKGFIHGRAASDTKGAIAAQIYAGYLLKQKAKLKGSVYFTFVVDEEPGDMWGMKRMCMDRDIGTIKLVILGEATSLDLYLGHRGRTEIVVETRGKMSHSSAPWLGVNAVNKMADIIKTLEGLEEELSKDEFLGKGSAAITHISCKPGWGSTVPDYCKVHIDVRFVEEDSEEKIMALIKNRINKLINQDNQLNINIKIREMLHKSYTGVEEKELMVKPAYYTPKENIYVLKAKQALSDIGQNPKFGKWYFGTDGAYTWRKMGIPTIGYSCCEEKYAHTPKDRVNIDMILKSIAGYYAITENICGL